MKSYRNIGFLVLSLFTTSFLAACGGGGGGGSSTPPPPLSPPTATTSTLNTPTIDGALINGNVNPNGLPATAWFEYGEDSSLSNPTSTDNQAIGSGQAPLSINVTLAGLKTGTTYYYRVGASNSAGTAKGTIANFTTTSPPPTTVTTQAGNITTNSATLNGSVNPNGQATTAWFEWGTENALLSNKTADQPIGPGITAVPVTQSIGPLVQGTTYYFRVAARNTGGETKGEILSLIPSPNPPPIANAGIDQSVFMGKPGTLDGSASSDGGNGGTITYQWTQIAGPAVPLDNTDPVRPTFTAPVVTYPSEVLTFQLTVTSDRGTSATDSVNITVKWGVSDDFSTDTTNDYTVEITRGVGTLTYDPSGQRALVTTGDDDVIQYSKVVSPSNAGVFSLDFSPIVPFPRRAGLWVRLYQNPINDNTFYEISNFDWSSFGFPPVEPDLAAFKKFVGGVEVERVPFPTSYLQGGTYHIKITFGPAVTTMEAFGQKFNLSGTSNTIGKFEIETGQQNAYYDNILLEAVP